MVFVEPQKQTETKTINFSNANEYEFTEPPD